MRHPLVYEINARCWLGELSAKASSPITLANVPASQFEQWQRWGFTHIWLMGVWTSGPRSRAVALAVSDLRQAYGGSIHKIGEMDIVGSPYAIAEYRVPEKLGGDAGLQKFREHLHQYGIKLILDFVPNHVGLDHPWLKARHELFVQTSGERPGTFAQETKVGQRWLAHGKDPYFAPWTDTAQLDYRLTPTRSAMREQLLSVAGRCDGVRCDMAMLILNEVFEKTWQAFPLINGTNESSSAPNSEFWSEAISETRNSQPGFLFLAEAYWGLEARLQSLGFDYTYNKEIYDELIRRNPTGVQEKLACATPEFLAACAFFLENHDEPRIASLFSFDEHRVAATLLFALPGMRLVHEGQLSGARVRTPVQLGCRVPEVEDDRIRQMYEHIIDSLRETIIGKGHCTIVRAEPVGDFTEKNIILLHWSGPSTSSVLVAINLSPEPSRGYLPNSVMPPGGRWTLHELGLKHDPDERSPVVNDAMVGKSLLNLCGHDVRLRYWPGTGK